MVSRDWTRDAIGRGASRTSGSHKFNCASLLIANRSFGSLNGGRGENVSSGLVIEFSECGDFPEPSEMHLMTDKSRGKIFLKWVMRISIVFFTNFWRR